MNQTYQDTNQDQRLHLGEDRIQDALGRRDRGPLQSPVPGPVYPERRDALQTGLDRMMAAPDGRDDAQ